MFWSGKVLEKIVCTHLKRHLLQVGYFEKFQSAYREAHSTETALLKVQNDVLHCLGKRSSVALVLLDLRSAFDTIDHQLLLQRLESDAKVRGRALKWFSSYLNNRNQCVVIGGKRSTVNKCLYGVPQGSVLGPMLFTIYTTPLGKIISDHGLSLHMYADDTQIYLCCDVDTMDEKLGVLEACIDKVKLWMEDNFLKLNGEKTEFLIVQRNKKASSHYSLNIDGCDISASSHVRNLGVTFDGNINLEKHVNNICRSAYYNIFKIGKVRKYLSQAATKQLVHALVILKLDYANALLYGLPSSVLSKLQRVQNMAARMITKTKKSEHISPILEELHWLPIRQRITYKVLLYVFKCVNSCAPAYLQELIQIYKPTRNLRSREQILLVKHRSVLKVGERCFSIAGPELWNSLPHYMRSIDTLQQFKKDLKTLLFKQAFYH